MIKVFDEKLSSLRLDLSKYFFNRNFSIEKNYKFLDGIYATKCKEFLSQIRFVMHKFNKDNPFGDQQKVNIKEISKKSESIIPIQIDNLKNQKYDEFSNDNKNIINELGPSMYQKLNFIGRDIFLNEEQIKNLRKCLFSNYKYLSKFAEKFDDNFTKELINNLFKKNQQNHNKEMTDYIDNYVTKNELLKYIEDNKKDILFEIFFNYDVFNVKNFDYSQKSRIFRFIVSHLFSELGNFWIEFFNPRYSVTDTEKKDFINQIKALNYLVHNIKNEDYPRAYACFANIHQKNYLINRIKENLEIMAKNQILCDIIENHIDASQYLREQKI